MKGNNNRNVYRINNLDSNKNSDNVKEKINNNRVKSTNVETNMAVKNAMQRQKVNNAMSRHREKMNALSSRNTIDNYDEEGLDGENTQSTNDTSKTSAVSSIAGEGAKAAVRNPIVRKYVVISVIVFLGILFTLGILLGATKNVQSILFGKNNETAFSDDWDFEDVDDKSNPYAQYQELYEKIEEEYEHVWDAYKIRIDKALLLATLTAPMNNEIFNDETKDNEDETKWFDLGKQMDVMIGEVPTLARMQIMTVKAAGRNNPLCEDELDMKHFAMNDEEKGIWESIVEFLMPWTFFKNEASRERNYKCTTSVDQEYKGQETLVYVKSIEEADYEIDRNNDAVGDTSMTQYTATYDPETGGVYFWNLVNEEGFIQSYYQKYLATDKSGDIDYEKNEGMIYKIAEQIYQYYNYINEKEICGDIPIYDTDLSSVVVREMDGSENTYDLEFYVSGVMAAEFNGAFYNNSSEAVGLGFYDGSDDSLNLEAAKAFAIIVRTYTVNMMKSQGFLWNSSDNQNFSANWMDHSDADQLAQATKETEGRIGMINGDLGWMQYDAFCPTTSEPLGQWYELTVNQRSIRIGIDWGGVNAARAMGYLECPCGGRGTKHSVYDNPIVWTPGTEIHTYINYEDEIDGVGYNCWEGGRLGLNPRPPVHTVETYYNESTQEYVERDKYTYTYKPTGGHGNGASQFGIKYLGLTGYASEEIVKAFFERGYVEGSAPDEVGHWEKYVEIGIMSNYLGEDEEFCLDKTNGGKINACGLEFSASTSGNYTGSIAGDPLEQPLEEALAANGYDIECLNSCISQRVQEAGPGTRAGVVEAGISLLECMSEMTGGYTLPYDHSGGKVGGGRNPDLTGKLGVNSLWGVPGGTCNTSSCRYGLNCANFVRWAFCNGGMDLCSKGSAGAFSMTSNTYFPEQTTVEFRGRSVSGTDPRVNSLTLSELVRIAEPGDTITSDDNATGDNDHAMLIVGKDSSGYYIAENGRKTRKISFSSITDGKKRYKLNLLDDYYANSANKNSLYGG